jgi:hypothetical protein
MQAGQSGGAPTQGDLLVQAGRALPCAEHFAKNPLEAPCCRTRRCLRAKSRLSEQEATQGRHAVPTALSEDALLLCDNEAVLHVIRKWVGNLVRHHDVLRTTIP